MSTTGRSESSINSDERPQPLWTALRESPGVLRLALVRFTGQFGDGMFQAALSGAILFNPERQTDPLAIAAGFAVLLLPYSLIGPYAGALLDRWDRRAVLLVANVTRAALIALVCAGLLAGVGETPLLLLALAVVGISRFVLSGVSAALPRVLDQHWLVPMNSVLATVASGCAGVGAATSVAVIGLIGAGDFASAVAVAVSCVGPVVSALLAAGFAPRVLGPDADTAESESTVHAIATGLRTGATAVWESVQVTTAMLGIGTHRIVFGINTLIMVLVLRQAPAEGSALDSGLLGFGVAIAAIAAGMLVAAVVAPLLIPRLGRSKTVVAGLVTATMVQLTLVTPIALAEAGSAVPRAHQLLLVGAFLLGLAGQTIKLTGDAVMQIDIDDARRGQVFALQDTVFNIAFIVAIAAAALVVPDDGRSLPVILTGAGIYCAGIAAIAVNAQRRPKNIGEVK
ncbi:MFS transporter [Nocardia ninae]|uniref:Putative MFS-type transporter n=1 Tax=Nocardia ninae NBRC 108245 TaxID=1210091 RepID=A0A511MPL6_9NOCA|nr:putative MFS-type transporter [Nocardia ninae NBRC 108245]